MNHSSIELLKVHEEIHDLSNSLYNQEEMYHSKSIFRKKTVNNYWKRVFQNSKKRFTPAIDYSKTVRIAISVTS